MKTLYTISLLLVFLLFIQCKPTNNNNFKRSITLNGQSNFRDIGNYTTESSETIKSGMVYRSGALSNLD